MFSIPQVYSIDSKYCITNKQCAGPVSRKIRMDFRDQDWNTVLSPTLQVPIINHSSPYHTSRIFK